MAIQNSAPLTRWQNKYTDKILCIQGAFVYIGSYISNEPQEFVMQYAKKTFFYAGLGSGILYDRFNLTWHATQSPKFSD